jgi:hypothetical protein
MVPTMYDVFLHPGCRHLWTRCSTRLAGVEPPGYVGMMYDAFIWHLWTRGQQTAGEPAPSFVPVGMNVGMK